jgi:hypothetical protein
MTITRDPRRAGGLAYQVAVSLATADRTGLVQVALNDTTGYLGRRQRTTVRGHTAYWATPVNGTGPYGTLSVPHLGGFTEVRVRDESSRTPSRATMRSVFAGIELHGRPDQPLTWSTHPFG